MKNVDLKIAVLRKLRGFTQQELADLLGVSFQTVSKWENHVTMPDITMLPALAELFEVSVDELLGLKPLAEEVYLSRGTAEAGYWEERADWLLRVRKDFWNEDYLDFLVEKVWKLTDPVSVLDCGCGCGAFGLAALPLLPEGSTYTGIDFAEKLLETGRQLFDRAGLEGRFVNGDFYAYPVKRTYDLVVCQCVLRHVNDAEGFLERMVRHTKPGGLVVCIEVNRELECGGLYVEGMDYGKLCAHEGLKKLWACEKKKEGRDWSAAIKAAHMMKRLGLKEIGIRLNDRVHFISPETEESAQNVRAQDEHAQDGHAQDGHAQGGHAQQVKDFMEMSGWKAMGGESTERPEEREPQIRALMSRGMDRKEADEFLEQDGRLARFFEKNRDEVSFTRFQGALITFGRKEKPAQDASHIGRNA